MEYRAAGTQARPAALLFICKFLMKLNKRKVNKLNILVIGDICVDRFHFGTVKRLSPEGPIPILDVDRVEQRLGMAGNVAANLKALGANVALCGVVENFNTSNDNFVVSEIVNKGIIPATFYGETHKTIYKNRLISGNQIIYRFDEEKITSLEAHEEENLKQFIINNVKQYDCVVISDYGKGFLSIQLASTIVTTCKINNIMCLVDPDVHKPIYSYLDSTVIKCNVTELNKWGTSLEQFKNDFVNSWCDNFIVTAGSDGMYCKKDDSSKLIHSPAFEGSIIDAVGAGDVALSVLAICLTLNIQIKDCMKLANKAAYISTVKLGTATATLDEVNGIL